MTNISTGTHLRVIGFFAIISCVYVLANMNGVPSGDGYMNYHGFWWFRKAVSMFSNPFYTDYFYYPQGANIAFYGGTAFSSALLTLPLSFLAGVPAAVLAAHFLGYFLSGYFTFLLAYDLIKSVDGALFAGAAFAFAPYHFFHVPIHMILSSFQWIPLYLLLLKRTAENTDFKWPVFTGLAYVMVLLTDQMQAILVSWVTLLALPFLYFKFERGHIPPVRFREQSLALTRRFCIIAATVAIAGSFYFYPMFDFLLHSRNALHVGPFDHGGANQFSADLLGFFIPPAYHPLWGAAFSGFDRSMRSELFLGYAPLFLAFTGLCCCRRERCVQFVALVTVGAFICSLGTTLHLNGVWEWSGRSFSLPFFYLAKLKIFEIIRTPYRFHPLTLLGVTILAGYGIAFIARRIGSRRPATVVVFGGVCFLLVEFMPGPTGYHAANQVPAIYSEIAKDPEPYTVLELPLSRWDSLVRNGAGGPAQLLYFQSVHGKRIFNGHSSRAQIESIDFNDPILDTIKDLCSFEQVQIVGREKRQASDGERFAARQSAAVFQPNREEWLRRYNIRYIIVHAPLNYEGSVNRTFIESLTGRKMIDVPADAISYVLLPK